MVRWKQIKSFLHQWLIALASEKFAEAGYSVKREHGSSIFPTEESLLAEDDFGIVAMVVFETWSELVDMWPMAQSTLVKLVSNKVARTSPKFYDAYLMLVCRSVVSTQDMIAKIERDTNRVRKYVIHDSSLKSSKDFVSAMDPLMPLNLTDEIVSVTDALDLLPDLLESSARPDLVKTAVEAYRDLSSPVEAIHQKLNQS